MFGASAAWKKPMFLALALTGVALLTSCATKKDILALHAESMAQDKRIEERLATLERSVSAVDSATRAQYRFLMGMRAVSGTQSQNQEDRILSLSARLDNIYYLMKELNQKLQAIQLYGGIETPVPKTETARPDSQGASQPAPPQTIMGGPSVDPKEVYNAALADLNRKDLVLAESRFVAFLIQFPRHELAPNAQYWLGEVDYARKKYELSAAGFDKVIKNYPQSDKVPAALLKQAYCFIELKKKGTAQDILRQIIKDYKNTEEAKIARERLKKL